MAAEQAGIVVGIKVDKGLAELPGSDFPLFDLCSANYQFSNSARNPVDLNLGPSRRVWVVSAPSLPQNLMGFCRNNPLIFRLLCKHFGEKTEVAVFRQPMVRCFICNAFNPTRHLVFAMFSSVNASAFKNQFRDRIYVARDKA